MARILIATLLAFSFTAFAQTRDLNKLYKKTTAQLGTAKIQVWLADNDKRREDGLMFIEKMPEDTGMLFIFEEEAPRTFWMKNTIMPLAIGFFNAKAELIDIQEMTATSMMDKAPPPTYQSRGPAMFALEMNKGWFDRHKVKEGAILKLEVADLLRKQLHLNKSSRH